MNYVSIDFLLNLYYNGQLVVLTPTAPQSRKSVMKTVQAILTILAVTFFGLLTTPAQATGTPLIQYNYLISFNYQTGEIDQIGFGSVEVSTCGRKLRMSDLRLVEAKATKEFSAIRVIFLGSIPLEETTCSE